MDLSLLHQRMFQCTQIGKDSYFIQLISIYKYESKVLAVVLAIIFSANCQTDYSNYTVLTIPSHPFPNHSDLLKLCQHHYKYLNHFPPRCALPLSRQLKITKREKSPYEMTDINLGPHAYTCM